MRNNRGIFTNIDWISVLIYLALVVFGYMAVYAADYNMQAEKVIDFSRSHGKQLIWILVSLGLAGLILLLDSKFFTTFAYPIYGFVLGLLVLVLLIGSTIKGSKSWLTLGGFSLQPAEFAKFATGLAVAKYLSALGVNIRDFSARIISGVIIAIPVGLIVLQGDAGSALVFGIFILVLYREGLPAIIPLIILIVAVLSISALIVNKYILIGVIVLTAAVIAFYLRRNRQVLLVIAGIMVLASAYVFTVDYTYSHLKPHRKDRIAVYIAGLTGQKMDTKGVGYNVNQSQITIGSGGLTGKGFLNGTQTAGDFVPEQITDFIFSTIGEEYGFLGSALVLGLLFGLTIRVIFLAERQRSRFTRIYGYVVACVLFFHIMVNVGMTISLVPVMGIPLPFFSYGGSSIIAFTILLFILLKLDSERLAVLR
ncbi:MAG: rod shape-determining protein RodA [Chitinophagales bacterium]|nr:rod shape-determining protein RodA [Chitinophagales bacterium]